MISAFFASNAAEVEVCPDFPCCNRSNIAAVEAENCGKLGAAPALPFTGKVFIWADHAGALGAIGRCGVTEVVVLADASVECDA
jgi:hypothetical protein